jgi:hypothetical protein
MNGISNTHARQSVHSKSVTAARRQAIESTCALDLLETNARTYVEKMERGDDNTALISPSIEGTMPMYCVLGSDPIHVEAAGLLLNI